MNSTTTKMQTLRCQYGEGHAWERPSQRGKPPKFCPEHREAGLEQARTQFTQRIAKAHAELDSLEQRVDAAEEVQAENAEEIRKRQEAARKRQATIAAKKAQEEREAAEKAREELAHINATIGDTFRSYEQAFEKANKTNTPEDWHKSEILMDRCIGMRHRQRTLQSQVSA